MSETVRGESEQKRNESEKCRGRGTDGVPRRTDFRAGVLVLSLSSLSPSAGYRYQNKTT